ncbi:UDP-glucuronosyltransferase 2B9 isoform X1 [Harpegnathos saltator]|uniref:UDP-glucuronosyltransferase 2B9 isoform X1 n=2 Tax=Harpegnathos saltator TaxID=610380 RepID=UPI000DBED60B|nr:UDP-glucuronosyltransferase 2B9 isoform X1 [Harpegnathos saltator]XP_025163007.1 UDP-glucuronosyltransferase 2B9 isoform X1 [Harpegnathos saltator]
MKFTAISLGFWLASFLCVVKLTEGARILAMVAAPSYSHQIAFQSLWAALSQRGHQVVVFTTDPIGDPSLTNLTEIDFRHTYDILRKIDYAKLRYSHNWLSIMQDYLQDNFEAIVEEIFKHPEVRKLYAPNSGEKFDVVLAEVVTAHGLYALAHRFNAPLIGISSLPLQNNHYYHLGSPILPSHPSTWEMQEVTGFNLSLWHRIKNFIRLWRHIHYVLNHYMQRQQAIAEKYLGKGIPNVNEMEKNMSIMLVNQQEITMFVRPLPPNLIQFGGLHIMKNPAPLPNDLQQFLDDAPNGFIYVSLGTNVKMTSFPSYVLRVFYEVFASLPYKIVWKFNLQLPDKFDNIFTATWLPQQSILAHPNIKLFVYQGGIQSTQEAVHYAVPLFGIPVFADQYSQINKMVSLGVAKSLDITNFSVKKLNTSIMDILTDKRYKERMLKVKALNDDKPYDMLKHVIWWIEYVIRHRDVSHLHTSIKHDPWYERYDVDVIAVLSIVTFVILMCALMIMYKMLKITIKYFYSRKTINIKEKTT